MVAERQQELKNTSHALVRGLREQRRWRRGRVKTIRRLEDLDTAALTYAEVKAIASGEAQAGARRFTEGAGRHGG